MSKSKILLFKEMKQYKKFRTPKTSILIDLNLIGKSHCMKGQSLEQLWVQLRGYYYRSFKL